MELNRLGRGDMWRRGMENNNNTWREVGKSCVDIEHQKMEANMGEKRSLALYNELKNQLGKRKLLRSLYI
jgi:hypothetical protein